MKQFIFHFVIIFVAVFSVLNSRFVAAQIKFNFFDHERLATVAQNETPLPRAPLAKMFSTPWPTLSIKTYPREYNLEIPTIGVNAPIIFESSVNQDIIFKRLEDGVVHYGTSPLPGERGTAIILGHSSAYPWYKGQYGSVFALLEKLKKGAVIKIHNGNRTLNYEVKEYVIFHPLTNDEKINKLEKTNGSSIVLVSCWPVGTNYKRIAVRADFISITK